MEICVTGKNVLVIDDVEIVFSAFINELEKEGFDVDTALSGEVAVKMAELKKYDLVFVDLIMPGMDGIQTCRELKTVSPESTLIAMTGQIYRGLADRELEFVKAGGKVYFLYKPFHPGEILQVTREALSNH